MQIHRTWTSRPWCQVVEEPYWPMAYQKKNGQILEEKGRVADNVQDMRHACTLTGGRSKCHLCEDMVCGTNMDQTCAYQLQGISSSDMTINIPTVTDVPWSVGGSHRYDFNGGSHMCLMLSGGECITPTGTDYSNCITRCWGVSSGTLSQDSTPPQPVNGLEGDSHASDLWTYPNVRDGDAADTPQGRVLTLAGGSPGFQVLYFLLYFRDI